MVYATPAVLERLNAAEAQIIARKRFVSRLVAGIVVLAMLSALMLFASLPGWAGTIDGRSAGPLPVGETAYRLSPARFAKWHDLLGRHIAETARWQSADMQVKAPPENFLIWQAWRSLTEAVAGQPPETQLLTVNAFFNTFRYASDQATWRSEEYWATPLEFVRRGQGDCEDFAAGKFFALRAAGFPADRLWLAVALIDGRSEAHALVLAIMENGIRALDHRWREPKPLAALTDMRILYTVSERDAWLYLRTRPPAPRADTVAAAEDPSSLRAPSSPPQDARGAAQAADGASPRSKPERLADEPAPVASVALYAERRNRGTFDRVKSGDLVASPRGFEPRFTP